MSAGSSHLLQRVLLAISAGGLFSAGFAAGRVTAPVPDGGPAPTPSASGAGYVRVKPGTYPTPPQIHNACYAAGTRTAPLPCLDKLDPQLPMLLGQCGHPASSISDGPSLGQYAGSPAVICCYKAEMPSCSGRPLCIADSARIAGLRSGVGWG